MLLELSILRRGGSKITFGPPDEPPTHVYHFNGPPEGPHTCEVTDKDHLRTLLSIEGYTVADEGSRTPRSAGMFAANADPPPTKDSGTLRKPDVAVPSPGTTAGEAGASGGGGSEGTSSPPPAPPKSRAARRGHRRVR